MTIINQNSFVARKDQGHKITIEVGVVIAIGTGSKDGKVQVKWPDHVFAKSTRTGKRTWILSTRLAAVDPAIVIKGSYGQPIIKRPA